MATSGKQQVSGPGWAQEWGLESESLKWRGLFLFVLNSYLIVFLAFIYI